MTFAGFIMIIIAIVMAIRRKWRTLRITLTILAAIQFGMAGYTIMVAAQNDALSVVTQDIMISVAIGAGFAIGAVWVKKNKEVQEW